MTGVALGKCLIDDHADCPTAVKLPYGLNLKCGCGCHTKEGNK